MHSGEGQEDICVWVAREVALAEKGVFVEPVLYLREGGVTIQKSLHRKEQIYNKH